MLQDIGHLATFSVQGDVQDAAVFVSGCEIEWVGRTRDLPTQYQQVLSCSVAVYRAAWHTALMCVLQMHMSMHSQRQVMNYRCSNDSH